MTEADRARAASRRIAGWLRLGLAIVLISIPLRIAALGWLPQDDARRHAAKAFSGKSWNEILLLRPELTVDLHGGWHATLGLFREAGADTPRALVTASVVLLATLFLLAPFFRFPRPEAWVLALGAVALLEPAFFPRLLSGRPFVISMAALVLLAASWERARAERPPWPLLTALALVFAYVSWAHGNWYLWLVPLGCFFLAGERRAGLRLSAAWAAGTLAGALLTGQPVAYLGQWLSTLRWSFGTHDLSRMLATEFQPGQGGGALALAAALLLVWRRGALARRPYVDPVFLMALAGWVLGLAVSRFWSDWGLPALAVWGARELERALAEGETALADPKAPWIRASAPALAAAALFLLVTGNRGDRWSSREGERHLRLDNPTHRAWLPAPGGVLYSNSMGLFYDTFFENPTAPFRYALGFEPGLMPPEELAVLRGIQRVEAADAAFLPWARKLRPEDRLAVVRQGGAAPAIAGIEWHSPFSGIWLGRLAGGPPPS